MRWSPTPGTWARRERVLVSCLAAAAAIVALAELLDASWLLVAGAIVAAAGALARAAITWRQARLDDAVERLELARRTMAPIAPAGEIDPTQIGVGAAAQTILPGAEVPEYIPRDADDRIREAIAAALGGRGSWLVVVVGRSKVGKSRALFEALRHCEPLPLVAPGNAEKLQSLLTPGGMPRIEGSRCVLWLNDLETFLNDGVTFQTLREWRERFTGSIVVSTFGGKRAPSSFATSAQDVLQHAQEIFLEATTPSELEALRSRLHSDVMESIERHGLAAYLVAAQLLERKLSTRRHEEGDEESSAGVAALYAAVDWARCGRTDAIAHERLRELWRSYVSHDVPATDAEFESGLAWALRPVAGTVGLLERVGGYRAYDYVVRLVDERPGSRPPRDEAWASAFSDPSPAQALAVAGNAHDYGRYGEAMDAWRRASRTSSVEVAAIALFNLGMTLGQQGRYQEAIVVYDDVVARCTGVTEPDVREPLAMSLVNKGAALGELGRSDEQIAAYDDVIERFHRSSEPVLRHQVAIAMLNKGSALGDFWDSEAGLAVLDEAVGRLADATDPDLRDAAAKAMFDRALTLSNLGRPADAVAAYQELVQRFAHDPGLRQPVAKALVHLGGLLGELGRDAEALPVVEEVVVRYGDDAALRPEVAGALLERASVLCRLGRVDEELAVYDDVVARFSGAERPLQPAVASALLNKALLLGERGGFHEAIAVYDDVVAAYGDATEPTLVEHVAKALVNKGFDLGELGRSSEAIAAYDTVVERFGDASEPSVCVAIALALINKGQELETQGRRADAVAAYDEVLARFPEPEDPSLRDEVAAAARARRAAMGRLS